ncbi:uncharacterized protein LOC126325818 isoform X2 [Schistocerca gregaria]|uniref:uncharacterized protein LOC126325818 isoform X2 n=1 Tax=Schistocerca gregaria TaxID=7010 RepID=UPI00211F3118|nr:uncharacterized protein LOC126325818 isoform X2 [Schistocerca gregaria]
MDVHDTQKLRPLPEVSLRPQFKNRKHIIKQGNNEEFVTTETVNHLGHSISRPASSNSGSLCIQPDLPTSLQSKGTVACRSNITQLVPASESTTSVTHSAFTREWMYDHRTHTSVYPHAQITKNMKAEDLWIDTLPKEGGDYQNNVSSVANGTNNKRSGHISSGQPSYPASATRKSDMFLPTLRVSDGKGGHNNAKGNIEGSSEHTNSSRSGEASHPISATEKFFREIQSLLNKLTTESHHLVKQLQQKFAEIDSPDTLTVAIKLIHTKASSERKYSRMYSELCKRLEEHCPVFPNPDQKKKAVSFMRIMLNELQTAFEKKVGLPPLLGSEDEDVFYKNRDRVMGNIVFMGELYVQGLIPQGLLQRCINSLIESIKWSLEKKLAPNSEELAEIETECEKLIALVTVVGSFLNSNATEFSNQVIEGIKTLACSDTLNLRVRFLIQNVIDDHMNGWIDI